MTEASLPSVVKFLLQTSRVDQASHLINELRSCFQFTDLRGASHAHGNFARCAGWP